CKRVGVDVIRLAILAERDRREHRDKLASEYLLKNGRIDSLRLADETEIDFMIAVGLGIVHGARHFRRAYHIPVLAAEADGAPAFGIDEADDLLVDRSGEHHLDDFHRRLIGD